MLMLKGFHPLKDVKPAVELD